MAFFASTNVTLTISHRQKFVADKLRMNKVNIAFGNGSLAYCSGGVPLPAIGNLGFHREISFMGIQEGYKPAEGSNYICRYDPDNHKIVLLQPYATISGGALNYYGLVQIASGSTPTVNVDVLVVGE